MSEPRQAEHWTARHGKPIIFVILTLVAVGIYLAFTIPVSVFPSTDFPRIVIGADNGVAPIDQMLVTVTRPVEEAMNAVQGLRRVKSITSRGTAESATGPFYCPGDQKGYLDLSFFQELRTRFGAPGEFAEAYVVAHELGHHVQNLLGIEAKVSRLRRQEPSEANPLSVRTELQADCFAGVWGHSTEQRNIIDQSDIDQGLRAAAAIGDDRLQRMATGRVMPEKFTHGTSAQREEWFKRGLENGDVRACNTFGR